jgi:O-antigen/teichoic acid export membrane protein
MLGLKEVGIYSIGAKVASVSSFIYAAFAGGWQYFAFSTMKDKDQVELTSKVFEYLAIVSFVSFAAATLCNEFIFNLFFIGDYVKGSVVFPYLFLSPLILMLFQTAGNQLLVVKKSYLITICLSLGLLINLTLNYFLIPLYGIKGAALATLLGHAGSALIILFITFNTKLLYVKVRFILALLLTITVTTYLFFANNINNIFLVIAILVYMVLYYKLLHVYIKKLVTHFFEKV